MSPRRIDELYERQRRLDAERLRPERPPPHDRGPMWELIRLLDGLLTRPGPPDREITRPTPDRTKEDRRG